jgi:hypothetical protein
MICPHCGRGTIVDRGSYATEPHGETHWDEWSQCDGCGERFDDGELADELAWLASLELAHADLAYEALAAPPGELVASGGAA